MFKTKKRGFIIGVILIILVIVFLIIRIDFTGKVIKSSETQQSITKTYIYAGNLLASKSSDSSETTYYIQDHLGSNRKVIDGEVQENEFYAFGEEKLTTGNSNNKYKYTGKPLDDETGLYYYGARYYKPELGRFIQADALRGSLVDPLSLNRYAYVSNNPLKYVDPSGNAKVLADSFAKKVATAFNQYKIYPHLSPVGKKIPIQITLIEKRSMDDIEITADTYSGFRRTFNDKSTGGIIFAQLDETGTLTFDMGTQLNYVNTKGGDEIIQGLLEGGENVPGVKKINIVETIGSEQTNLATSKLSNGEWGRTSKHFASYPIPKSPGWYQRLLRKRIAKQGLKAVPYIGIPIGATSAGVKAAQGNYFLAGIDAAGSIPFIGNAVDIGYGSLLSSLYIQTLPKNEYSQNYIGERTAKWESRNYLNQPQH